VPFQTQGQQLPYHPDDQTDSSSLSGDSDVLAGVLDDIHAADQDTFCRKLAVKVAYPASGTVVPFQTQGQQLPYHPDDQTDSSLPDRENSSRRFWMISTPPTRTRFAES
jgi:hypothetical protein